MSAVKKNYWLVKSEPSTYGIDAFKKDKRTPWEGVRNYQARNHMRDGMAVGDLVLFYHSSAEPTGVAGIAKVASKPHADETQFDKSGEYFDPKATREAPRWMLVDLAFVEAFKAVVSRDAMAKNPKLKDMVVLQRGQRPSVQPVRAAEFAEVLKMAGAKTKPRRARGHDTPITGWHGSVRWGMLRPMTLRVYNTLTQKVEPFEPADPSHARVYVCGPTVYDYAHMGHARCYVVYDLLVRHLRASGMKVTFVRNVTDVDDKILKRAGELGEKPLDLSERFRKAYVEDMHRLGNLDPDIEPKVSDHLDDIVTLIGKLIDRGAAYQVDGDVYFRVSAFPGYGKLSHRKLEDLLAGASGRTDEARQERKEHPADFALWKKSEAGTLSWPSPWGEGRPGWHIECSAMSARYLGETFDLHGGGLDLVFPHHENEIAQSEAASGKPFVTHWMHNGFVETNKEKMSKSLGNFFTIRDMFERVDAEAIRYFMLTVSYRGPLAFDWDLDAEGYVTRFPQLADAEERLEYLYTTLDRFAAIPTARVSDASRPPAAAIAEFEARIAKALDDDLNFPVALAHVAELLSSINELADRLKKGKETIAGTEKSAVDAALGALRARLGLGAQDVRQVLLGIRERRARSRGIEGERVDSLIRERAEARTAKDFQRADALRKELQELGVELLDTPEGTSWRVPA